MASFPIPDRLMPDIVTDAGPAARGNNQPISSRNANYPTTS